VTVHDLRTLTRRLETTFPGRCAQQFVALQGLDRAVVLSSQAFTALIPLLLLVSALAPAGGSDVVASSIVRRFELGGESADAVNQLFAHSGDSATGVFSVFLLLFSGVSLARRLQRMYQQAWGLEALPGVGRALNAAMGLVVLVLGISLLYAARTLVGSLPAGDVLVAPVSVVASFVVWTSVPWLLLDRRIAWRRLIPAGALTATCTSLYGVASTIYMPPLFESYSERYGLFGVTLALIGWLLSIALIVVASTAISSEFDRVHSGWALGIRRLLRLEEAAVPPIPTQRRRHAEPDPPPVETVPAGSSPAAGERTAEPGGPPKPPATADHRSS
jgi:membrane protein